VLELVEHVLDVLVFFFHNAIQFILTLRRIS
jgi:hypothetical protein